MPPHRIVAQIAAQITVATQVVTQALRRTTNPAGAERGGYDGHETGDRSKKMNNAPSGPPMRGAAFDSWRSLRAARGSLLLTTGTAYHRKESKGGRPKTAGITLDGMNEH